MYKILVVDDDFEIFETDANYFRDEKLSGNDVSRSDRTNQY